MNYPKYYIGPMSKNVVDSILEFCNETGNDIGLIPSRRQVECSGGYVNNWTTETFSRYAHQLLLKRDHAGPGQGYIDDDGFESLKHDCSYFDMIHIDPWKKYPNYEEGLNWTIKMVKYCYNLNPNILFEVGTEESIRKFKPNELDTFLTDLQLILTPAQFDKIVYIVIQSGTSLKGNTNTGQYSKARLKNMIKVAKKHNKLTKEHNGDYIPVELIKEKMELGLDSLNIAPEFGLIETETYLHKIQKEAPDLFGKMYNISYISNRWKKWVNKDFKPEENKEELIRICGHYILSTQDFLTQVKSQFADIDVEIKNNIKRKLYELFK